MKEQILKEIKAVLDKYDAELSAELYHVEYDEDAPGIFLRYFLRF